MICDNCKQDLKKYLERDRHFSQVIAINDSVGGCSVMEHYNIEGWILIDEECFDVLRQELIDNCCWSDLDTMDNNYGSKYFIDTKELEEWLKTKTTVVKKNNLNIIATKFNLFAIAHKLKLLR